MKTFIAIATFIGLTVGTQLSACGCCKLGAPSPTQPSLTGSKKEPKTVTLKVTGMTCAGCAHHLHSAFSKTPGILRDEVTYPGDIAIVQYDASKISEAEIIQVIEKAGYSAVVQKGRHPKDKSK